MKKKKRLSRMKSTDRKRKGLKMRKLLSEYSIRIETSPDTSPLGLPVRRSYTREGCGSGLRLSYLEISFHASAAKKRDTPCHRLIEREEGERGEREGEQRRLKRI